MTRSNALSGFACRLSLNDWQFVIPLLAKKNSASVLESIIAPVTFSPQRRVRMSSQ